MADQPSPVDTSLDLILRRLGEFDLRLRAIEARFDGGSAPDLDAGASIPRLGPLPRPSLEHISALMIASLTGRTCLVVGGGYLLRALADAGVLPLALAVVLGLAYAVLWLVVADQAGASFRKASATFHGLAAASLAFPLLVEVIVRFRLLGDLGGAMGLAAVAALGLVVAWRRRLEGLVWIVTAASLLSVYALVRAGQDVAPFALCLVVIAVMVDWVGDGRQWSLVRWPAAVAADAIVVWLAIQSALSPDPLRVDAAIAVPLALFIGSFASVAARILVRRQGVSPFEITQSAAAFVIGYGGAAYVARVSGLSTVPWGVAGLVLGACLYGVAFWKDAANLGRRNLHYFATMAIGLVIAGGTLAFRSPVAAGLWIVLAPSAFWIGKRRSHAIITSHGAAYLVAAATASGLLTLAAIALLATARVDVSAITPIVLAALAAAAVCAVFTPIGSRTLRSTGIVVALAGRRNHLGVPRAIALGALVLGLSGLAVTWVVAALARGDSDWGLVATIRTITLASAAVLMALLARGDRVREAAWLIYPLLIAAGVKILLEDFRQSDAGGLFVALIVYGGALILAPRLASTR